MFSRVLEIKTKRGQARALCAAAERGILPIIKKYPGLVDVMWMIPEESADSVLAISWWQSKEAAEKFRTEGYPAVAEIYQPFLEGGIQLRRYEVAVAMAHKVQVTKTS